MQDARCVDVAGPTITYTIKRDNSPVANNSYSESETAEIPWLGYRIQINFSINDNEELNPSATFNISNKDSRTITGNTSSTIALSLDDTKKSSSYSYKVTTNGARKASLTACDKLNNCTTKNIYFKIDTDYPTIKYEGYKVRDGKTFYEFYCESGLSGIKKFFGSDSDGHSAVGDRINSDYIDRQFIAKDDSGYYLKSAGSIYTTCASYAIRYTKTGDRNSLITTNGTYRITSKNPDCPEGFTEISNTGKCFTFSTSTFSR